MEDDLKTNQNGRQPQNKNGRWPQKKNGRRPHKNEIMEDDLKN